MADIARRSHARYPCDRPVEVFMGAAAGRKLGNGRLRNLSLSGAYLQFPGELQAGMPYRLRVDDGEEPLELPCRVTREGPRGAPQAPAARHYGLVFNLTAESERRLRRLIDLVRRQPPAPGEDRTDRSLRDYWSS